MNKCQIHASLVLRGSNFRQFALTHGYSPRTVRQVVDRWSDQRQFPRGRLTFRILCDLSKFIDQEIIPGLLSEQYRSGLVKG